MDGGAAQPSGILGATGRPPAPRRARPTRRGGAAAPRASPGMRVSWPPPPCAGATVARPKARSSGPAVTSMNCTAVRGTDRRENITPRRTSRSSPARRRPQEPKWLATEAPRDRSEDEWHDREAVRRSHPETAPTTTSAAAASNVGTPISNRRNVSSCREASATLRFRTHREWTQPGSNRLTSRCQRDALPAELWAPGTTECRRRRRPPSSAR